LKNNIKKILKDSDPVYTIGIASKLTNTSVYTLRLYEERRLIIPFKTNTNRRIYSRSDIARIKCIRKHLDQEGLNISGIKAIWSLVPCWLIRPCSKHDQTACEAFVSTTEPCWAVSKKGKECIKVDCRTCSVYLLGGSCSDMKSMYKSILKNN